MSEPWKHGAFRSKQNPFGALYEEVIKCCVQNSQSQTTEWMHIGKERTKRNTVKLYMKTERLQEEGGSILEHWYGTITKRYWQALYQLNHLPRELSRDTK